MRAPSQPSTRSDLTVATESVYRVFSAPVPSIIEGCPCCIQTRGVDVLLATPLRELTGKALWRYVSGAFLTVGGETDFRYLLPRILELSALTPSEVPDAEIVLGKLARANWQSWSQSEQDSIEAFIDAWFDHALTRDMEDAEEGFVGSQAESILCGAALAGMPLSRWLARLREPSAAPVLDDLKSRYPRGVSAFWEDAPSGLEELAAALAQGSG